MLKKLEMMKLKCLGYVGKRGLLLLIVLSLMLLQSGCSSAPIACKPPTLSPWMMEKQPLELNLQKELFERIKVGDIVEGTVKNVTDFGAFIDLGGADGLLHISEMSWGRVENPKKAFKVGDVLKVLIKEIDGTKIALSLKFDDANPWKDAAEKYALGNEVTGVVARMTDFGAFIELEAGIDALLHVSQISKEHIEKPSDVLKVGDEVTAKVVDFNAEDKKISLSIKAMFAPEADEEASEKEDADVVAVDIDAVIASDAE